MIPPHWRSLFLQHFHHHLVRAERHCLLFDLGFSSSSSWLVCILKPRARGMPALPSPHILWHWSGCWRGLKSFIHLYEFVWTHNAFDSSSTDSGSAFQQIGDGAIRFEGFQLILGFFHHVFVFILVSCLLCFCLTLFATSASAGLYYCSRTEGHCFR